MSAVQGSVADTAHRAFMDPGALDAASAFWVRFLDVMHGFTGVQANHRRLIELLDIKEGTTLLDVGCGTGNFARDVAPIVGPDGKIVGLDLSESMLGVANTRTAERGLAIDYHLGDATALPFADASFDVVRIERVLQYLGDPSLAVSEMMRVTKPGGRIAATEVDWDGIAVDCPDVDRSVWRRAIASISDGAGNGWQGRELRRLFLDAGLEDVICEGQIAIVESAQTLLEDLAGRVSTERARDAGAISAAEEEQFLASVRRLDAAGQFTGAIPLYSVVGRVPDRSH